MAKNGLIDSQTRVMNAYKSRGFVTNKRDEEGLHMAFSPNRVPTGLSKLQVRRKINAYFAGKIQPYNLFKENRLVICINGAFVLGASFKGNIPKNSKELHSLLGDLLKVSKTPKHRDYDVF